MKKNVILFSKMDFFFPHISDKFVYICLCGVSILTAAGKRKDFYASEGA